MLEYWHHSLDECSNGFSKWIWRVEKWFAQRFILSLRNDVLHVVFVVNALTKLCSNVMGMRLKWTSQKWYRNSISSIEIERNVGKECNMLSLSLLFQKVLEKNKNKKYDRTIAARATPEMECSVQGREIQNKHTHAHTQVSPFYACTAFSACRLQPIQSGVDFCAWRFLWCRIHLFCVVWWVVENQTCDLDRTQTNVRMLKYYNTGIGFYKYIVLCCEYIRALNSDIVKKRSTHGDTEDRRWKSK